MQIENVVKKANRILVMLKRTFYSRDPRLRRNLCVSLVRPHLEYAVQAWNPYLEIAKIEKVQIGASKIPEGFCKISYEGRIKIINITFLKDRMVRGYLIEMYKVIRGLDEIDWTKSALIRTNIDFTGPDQG